MTVEELEIIVSAKIEQIKPQMQKVVQEVKKAVQDTEGFGAKILSKSDTEKIIGQARKAGQKVKEAFNPNDTSGMKINGQNIIKGISKAYDSLSGKRIDLGNMVELSNYKNKLNEVATTAQKVKQQVESVKSARYDSASIQKFIDGYSRGANEVKKTQENLKKSTTQGNRLASAVHKIKNHLHSSRSGSNALSVGLSKASSVASAVSGKLKVGLGQIIKMAGALIGLRSIYNVLRNAASSWLSSQNTQAQQLQANIDYMKYALGSALAPVIETIVNLIYQALKGVQSLIYALTGVNIFANASAKAYASMAKSANSASKATESLNPSDIDEVHNIQEDKGSDGNGGSGGGIAPNFDLGGIDTANWSKLIDNIKNGNWYEIGATIGTKINESLEKIPWEKIKTTAGNIGKNIASFLNGGISSTDWKLVGGTLAEGINTAITFVGDFLKTFNFSETGKALADTITGFFDTVDWGKIGQMLSNGLSGALDFLLTFWANFDPKKVWDALWKVLSNIDWLGLLGKVAVCFLQAWWKVDPTVQIVKGVIKMFEGAINWIIRKVNQLKIPVPKWVQDWLGLPEEFSFNLQEIDFDVDHAMDKIVSSVTKGTETIENGIEDTSRTVQTNSNLIKTSMSRGMNGAYLAAKDNMSKTKSTFETTMTQLSNSSVFSKVKSTIQNALDQAKNSKTWGTNTTANYTEGINGQQSGLLTAVNSIKTKVQSYLNQSGYSSSWGSSTMSKYKDGINSQDNIITSALNSVKDKVRNALNDSNSYTWGYDMINGFMNGINAMKTKLTNTVKSVANSISKFLHFSRPDEGPLRDYETWMPDMITGLSDSLLNASPKLDNAVSQVSSNIADNLRATTLGVDVNSNINKNITSNVMSSQLENAVYSAIQKAENLFRLTINSELKLNSKTIAKEIIDDLNDEAKRRGYRPILEH